MPAPMRLIPALALAIVATGTLTAQPLPVEPQDPAPASTLCQVTRIHDGDTLHLDCGSGPTRVRLACIDAPELDQHPWGRMATTYLRHILPAQVRTATANQDLYRRQIAVLTDPDTGEDLGLKLVTAGLAPIDRRYCHGPRYIAAENAARTEGIGIWGEPGLHQRPWEHRKNKVSKARTAP
jgi:micrococcal nuclease